MKINVFIISLCPVLIKNKDNENVFLVAAITVLLISCSKQQPKFEISVNVENGDFINQSFIVSSIVNGEVVFADTTKIKGNKFTVKIPYTESPIMFATIPGIYANNAMFVIDSVGALNITIDENKISIGGTPMNDKLQAYNDSNDSIRVLLNELKVNYELKRSNDPNNEESLSVEYQAERARILKDNTAHLVDFIKENINNPLGEYFFGTYYTVALPEDQKKMKSLLLKNSGRK